MNKINRLYKGVYSGRVFRQVKEACLRKLFGGSRAVAKGGERMFGLTDPWIWGVYLLSLLSTAACVLYGLINWNKDAEESK